MDSRAQEECHGKAFMYLPSAIAAVLMHSVMRVCVYPVCALIFEILDLELHFWCVDRSSEYLGQVCVSRSLCRGQGHKEMGYTSITEYTCMSPLSSKSRSCLFSYRAYFIPVYYCENRGFYTCLLL